MESVLVLREQDFRSKKKMLSYIAEELEFPAYFGGNLDALMDCLRDVDKPTNIAFDPAPGDESKSWYSGICETIIDAAEENPNIKVFASVRRTEGDY